MHAFNQVCASTSIMILLMEPEAYGIDNFCGFFLYILRVEFRLSYSSMQRDKYCDLVPRDALTRKEHFIVAKP